MPKAPVHDTVNDNIKQQVNPISRFEPRQANLCLRAFRHDKFQLRMPSHSEGPGTWLSVRRFLLIHCLYERAAKVLARLRGCASLAWTFAARLGDKHQIRLTRPICSTSTTTPIWFRVSQNQGSDHYTPCIWDCWLAKMCAASRQNQQSESDQPGHLPSLVRVYAVHSMSSWGPKLSWCRQHSDQTGQMPRLCAQWVAEDQTFLMQTAKTLIRLGRCPGWSESSLGHMAICWFCYKAIIKKPIYAVYKKQWCRSACASRPSDQHLYCSLPRQYNTCSCYMSHIMTKPFAICEQQRCRSACAFPQSDQCLSCLLPR